VGQKNSEIKVSVKDSGIGISKQHLEKIFDRYYRVEQHAIQFQGLGIGLFISHEIIERHHGKLWAESTPGNGSTFYFTLPISATPSKKIKIK
ncbi:MAG: ATP-binding protein, partial [Ferruginibacter sp.]